MLWFGNIISFFFNLSTVVGSVCPQCWRWIKWKRTHESLHTYTQKACCMKEQKIADIFWLQAIFKCCFFFLVQITDWMLLKWKYILLYLQRTTNTKLPNQFKTWISNNISSSIAMYPRIPLNEIWIQILEYAKRYIIIVALVNNRSYYNLHTYTKKKKTK